MPARRREDLERGQAPALDAEHEAGAGKGRLPGDAEMDAFEAVGRGARHGSGLPRETLRPALPLVYARGIPYSWNMNRSSLIRRPMRYSYRNLSIWLIAVNVLVFALELIVPWTESLLAMTPVLVLRAGAFWQPLTYMFVHDPSNLTHIIVNMLGLLFFGPAVEKELGSREFLLLLPPHGPPGGPFLARRLRPLRGRASLPPRRLGSPLRRPPRLRRAPARLPDPHLGHHPGARPDHRPRLRADRALLPGRRDRAAALPTSPTSPASASPGSTSSPASASIPGGASSRGDEREGESGRGRPISPRPAASPPQRPSRRKRWPRRAFFAPSSGPRPSPSPGSATNGP